MQCPDSDSQGIFLFTLSDENDIMRTGFTDEVKAMTHQDSPLGTAPVGKLVLQLAIPAMLAQFVNI